jgi:dihydrofolate synthase/folylpolyglutamate synthase
LPEKELQKAAAEFGITGETFSDVNMAVNEALAHASPGDLIVVCGSVFVIAEVESIK